MPTDNVMSLPWTEVQTAAESAALSLGVSTGPAARFGAAFVRHLSEARDSEDLAALLEEAEGIRRLTGRVDAAVEDVVLGKGPHRISGEHGTLLLSFFEALPCAVHLEAVGDGVAVRVSLTEGSALSRKDHVDVPAELWSRVQALLERRPHASGRGAGLMEL